ncbi:hypothetical protein GCM10025876_16910 [Demequina litorisediminis]|uniref:Uncharacterized protein n=1 Tax=Demequina litorisediminis TaxID=1849022 RepID=A0ABQ6ICC0_9MICO|nr:hypothetical protein GCM10025876_16910 [Demequina litorisediminis]
MDGDEVRVAAACEQRDHLVSHLPARDCRTPCDHGARDLEAGVCGGARRRRIMSLALEGVGAIDTRGGHSDQEVTVCDGGIGALRKRENFGPPGADGVEKITRIARSFAS